MRVGESFAHPGEGRYGARRAVEQVDGVHAEPDTSRCWRRLKGILPSLGWNEPARRIGAQSHLSHRAIELQFHPGDAIKLFVPFSLIENAEVNWSLFETLATRS